MIHKICRRSGRGESAGAVDENCKQYSGEKLEQGKERKSNKFSTRQAGVNQQDGEHEGNGDEVAKVIERMNSKGGYRVGEGEREYSSDEKQRERKMWRVKLRGLENEKGKKREIE
jgi:hypothetical protein